MFMTNVSLHYRAVLVNRKQMHLLFPSLLLLQCFLVNHGWKEMIHLCFPSMEVSMDSFLSVGANTWNCCFYFVSMVGWILAQVQRHALFI